MVLTVAREYKWTPETIGSLYLDDVDFLGLEYWYLEIDKRYNPKKYDVK